MEQVHPLRCLKQQSWLHYGTQERTQEHLLSVSACFICNQGLVYSSIIS